MDTLQECFEDWTEITSAKRLRGCLLHACRILKRQGNYDLASNWHARIKYMPKRMDKEGINTVLMAACIETGLIK